MGGEGCTTAAFFRCWQDKQVKVEGLQFLSVCSVSLWLEHHDYVIVLQMYGNWVERGFWSGRDIAYVIWWFGNVGTKQWEGKPWHLWLPLFCFQAVWGFKPTVAISEVTWAKWKFLDPLVWRHAQVLVVNFLVACPSWRKLSSQLATAFLDSHWQELYFFCQTTGHYGVTA